MSSKRDYYEILGVKKSATHDDLKKAYRELALRHHPDRVSADKKKEAEDTFKEISEAYAVLSDPQKRALYDQYGHSGVDQKFAREDIFRGTDFGSVFEGMGDFGLGGGFFENLFGDLGVNILEGAAAGRESRPPRRRPGGGTSRCRCPSRSRKPTVARRRRSRSRATIPAPSAAAREQSPGTGKTTCPDRHGSGQRVVANGIFQMAQACPRCGGTGSVVQVPCDACHGEGKVRDSHTLSVTIPAGVETGSRLRIKGEGRVGKEGQG